MRLTVEFVFAAAHRLPRYVGRCFDVHGHNYVLRVSVEGPVDAHTGMVMDFGRLQELVHEHVLNLVDHKNLNDVMENPTAEEIVRWIWGRLEPGFEGKLAELELDEMPGLTVRYRGEDHGRA